MARPFSEFLTETGFDRAAIMRAAWNLARMRAARDGTSPRAQIGKALSGIWHNARCGASHAGRAHKGRMVRSFVAEQVHLYGTTSGLWRAA
jgi:hypothetical protein